MKNEPLGNKPFVGLAIPRAQPNPTVPSGLDPLESTLESLRNNKKLLESLGKEQPLSTKLLASLGQVYERHGFTAAHLFLADKKQRAESRDKEAFEQLDGALRTIHANAAVCKKPALGRMVLKSLRALAPQQDNHSSHSHTASGGNRR
ncbi:hypothetical protein IT570_07095 [Candidatus Sumerlaeota bacterium]|nr:hypothetical protein [Candidatus Sumerlaeota bacterium]